MSKQFTDKLISNLKPKEKKYYMREGRGFGVQVMPSGAKTFLYIYTFEGKRKQLNLGMYPHVKLADARRAYNDAYNLVNKGINPQALAETTTEVKEREDLTFGYFARLFLTQSEQRHSAGYYRTNKLSLNNDVLPFWKDKLITDIRRRDAIELLERVAKRSKGQVANVHKAARSVMEYALDRDYIDANPMLRLIKPIPDLKQAARDRYLSDVEIKAAWEAIETGPGGEGTKKALKLILVTAQRPGEVTGMHRREIDGNWWTIPKERVKNSKGDHMVYLTPTALMLIGNGEGFIFPSFDEDKHIHRQALSQTVCTKTKPPYYGLPRWTPHDLRRTARTVMSRLNIPDNHIEAVLNHSRDGMKKVYDCHDYREEKKAALLLWEAELLRLLKADAKAQPAIQPSESST